MNKKNLMSAQIMMYCFLLIFFVLLPMSGEGQDDYEEEPEGEAPQVFWYFMAAVIGAMIGIYSYTYIFPDGFSTRYLNYQHSKDNKILRKKIDEYASELLLLQKPIEEIEAQIDKELHDEYQSEIQMMEQKAQELKDKLEQKSELIRGQKETIRDLEDEIDKMSELEDEISSLKKVISNGKLEVMKLRTMYEDASERYESIARSWNKTEEELREKLQKRENRIRYLSKRIEVLEEVQENLGPMVKINWLIPEKKFRYVENGVGDELGIFPEIGIEEIPEGTDIFNPIGWADGDENPGYVEMYSNGYKLQTGIAQAVRDDLIVQKEEERKEQVEVELQQLAIAAKQRPKPTEEEIVTWSHLQEGTPVNLSYSKISILTGRTQGTIQAYVSRYRKKFKDNRGDTKK